MDASSSDKKNQDTKSKFSLLPITSTFVRNLNAQREEESRQQKLLNDDELLRESFDKLRSSKFLEGASTASGDLTFDTQQCVVRRCATALHSLEST